MDEPRFEAVIIFFKKLMFFKKIIIDSNLGSSIHWLVINFKIKI